MIVLALACVIWLEVLYMPFAFVDTEIVHEGVDIFTEALRDCKRTYEWFCQFGAKMFGAIGCRIGLFPNQITHRIFNVPTLRIVVPFRFIPVSVNESRYQAPYFVQNLDSVTCSPSGFASASSSSDSRVLRSSCPVP
jgi:hypothetical protein